MSNSALSNSGSIVTSCLQVADTWRDCQQLFSHKMTRLDCTCLALIESDTQTVMPWLRVVCGLLRLGVLVMT